MNNPYTTLFGKVPTQIIPRAQQTALVTNTFAASSPSQQVYAITGVRGVGKTVFMTDVCQTLAQDCRWIVEELSVEQDFLQSLVAKLNSRKTLARLFLEAEIDLSFLASGCASKGRSPS